MTNLLIITIFLPLLGAAVACAVSGAGRAPVRGVTLMTTLVTLALAGYVVWRQVSAGPEGIDYGTGWNWLGAGDVGVDVRFQVGLDGLSVWLFGLTALLMVTAVLVGWKAINDRVAGYHALLLMLATGMLGVFAARDIILFYVFFEFTLIPLFFLIGIWGSENRRFAALKFFLYTLAGSLLTFLGLLAIVLWVYYNAEPQRLTFSIPELTTSLTSQPMDATVQLWIFLALFAGFAIKVPLFPLHTWLPLAHVQAPTAGSVILAGVLLKIGTYGFARFSLPMLPAATASCAPWVLWLSVVGIIYGALVALAQSDMKKLIAYSSVSHLGFCMLGLFALNRLGVQGGVLQMINHGLSTGGLFAIVGMLYERYHTREISSFGGLASRTPVLATFMVLFVFSSIGLPGLNGFAGEFLLLLGMFQRGWADPPSGWDAQFLAIAVLAVSGVVLGAWYLLWLVRRVFFGPLHEPHHDDHEPIRDLSVREMAALAPLLVFVFWIGLYPRFFLDPMAGTLDELSAAAAAEMRRPAGAETATAGLEAQIVLRGEPARAD